MDHQNMEAAESDEKLEAFLCCICLDLLYKPVVLSCGHISCFWCVHKSMNGYRESNCPICRQPFFHFPFICEMLHFLFSKMYPEAYKRRESQMLDEEKDMDCFSPQLGNLTPLEPLANLDINKTNAEQTTSVNSVGSDSLSENNAKQVSVTDVLCAACKHLLCRPMALNCGHVYCASCLIDMNAAVLKCQVCQSLHPGGFLRVCLVFDHFLQQQFPEEYSLRRDAVQIKSVNKLEDENPTTCSPNGDKKGENLPEWPHLRFKVHLGAGCDYCGMYPIVGDRYKCKDCVERIGFDLCGDCYNTSSKRPGRFNQQHTPEHKFELIRKEDVFSALRLRVVPGGIEDGSTALFIANYGASNNSQAEPHDYTPSDDANETDEYTSSDGPVTTMDHGPDQNGLEDQSHDDELFRDSHGNDENTLVTPVTLSGNGSDQNGSDDPST